MTGSRVQAVTKKGPRLTHAEAIVVAQLADILQAVRELADATHANGVAMRESLKGLTTWQHATADTASRIFARLGDLTPSSPRIPPYGLPTAATPAWVHEVDQKIVEILRSLTNLSQEQAGISAMVDRTRSELGDLRTKVEARGRHVDSLGLSMNELRDRLLDVSARVNDLRADQLAADNDAREACTDCVLTPRGTVSPCPKHGAEELKK